MESKAAGNEFSVDFTANNPFILIPMLIIINQAIERAIQDHDDCDGAKPLCIKTFHVMPLGSNEPTHVLTLENALQNF